MTAENIKGEEGYIADIYLVNGEKRSLGNITQGAKERSFS